MDRTELGKVLRRARTRLQPQDVGLPAGGRRRVAGLRREEVALLAGVSVDYVVRLEQGRGTRPSGHVLRALARALRLDDDERSELFLLAGTVPPTPGTVEETVRPSVQRLVDRLDDLPVLVLSAASDVLAWNDLAAALLGDWSEVPLEERNLTWQRFLGRDDREVGRETTGEQERAAGEAHAVAGLRAAMARYPDDPGVRRLVATLRRDSPVFARLWSEGGVPPWRSNRTTVDHPSLGRMTFDRDALHVPDSDQTVLVWSAEPGSRESEALALLRVIGTQSMSSQR